MTSDPRGASPSVLEIGRVGKAHGLKGEVTATISSDRPERTEPGAVWILDDGPFTVAAIRPFQQRWIAVLDGITTREGADALRGQVISAEPIEDPDAVWVHDLVGAEVRTADGRTWGAISAVVPNPADDLLELENGTLVPSGFMVDTSGLPGHVVVDVPAGLLELEE